MSIIDSAERQDNLDDMNDLCDQNVKVDLSSLSPLESPRATVMQNDLLRKSVEAYQRGDVLPDGFHNMSPDDAKTHWINLYHGMAEAGYPSEIMLSLHAQYEALLEANPHASDSLRGYIAAHIEDMSHRYGFQDLKATAPEALESINSTIRQGDIDSIWSAVHHDQRFSPGVLKHALDSLKEIPKEAKDRVDFLYRLADEKHAANSVAGLHDFSELESLRPKAYWMNAVSKPDEFSFSDEILSCRDGEKKVPQKFTLLRIKPEMPVFIGEHGGEPIIADSGFLIKERGEIRFASENEINERLIEAQEEAKRHGQRPTNIASMILSAPIALSVKGFELARKNIRNQLNPEHLAKWRESRLHHAAVDSRAHLDSARKRLEKVMDHPSIIELRKERDTIQTDPNNIFSEYERHKVDAKIQQVIHANPVLKSFFDGAMDDIQVAADKHNEFLKSARKANLRPDQLLEMDKVDTSMLKDLKKQLKEVGLKEDSKTFEELEKMAQKIRETVQALLERFQNIFGMKQ